MISECRFPWALPKTDPSRVLGVLSRYVKGHVLPAIDRALYIKKTLQKIMRLEAEIQLRIRFDDSRYFDNTRLISDTLLLERAVQHAVNRFAGARITKILSPAVDGIPLAVLLAHRLGVKLVIAKKTREVGVREFIEEVYAPDKSAMIISLYVPRDALKRGALASENGIILDDDSTFFCTFPSVSLWRGRARQRA